MSKAYSKRGTLLHILSEIRFNFIVLEHAKIWLRTNANSVQLNFFLFPILLSVLGC